MSHFTVLVIGPDPDKQLARYSEDFEIAPYIAECSWCDGDEKFQPCEHCNNTGKETTTRNPQGMWDYWRVGGRFAGFLRLLPGAEGHLEPLSWEWRDYPDRPAPGRHADQCRRGALDIDAMRELKYRTYAVVAEGAWKGRGKMGCFGVSHGEEMTAEQWVEWWDRMVGGLDPNTLLTVVDCHV